MRFLLPSLALFSMLAGAAYARDLPQFQHLFPASAAPKSSGEPVNVRIADGPRGALRITPVIFLSKPGSNLGEGGSKSMCGVVIMTPARPAQGVVTVGTGITEATPSCDAVLAIGTLAPAHGQRPRRIGLIHSVSSRNAPGGREAIVLQQGADYRWVVDDKSSERVGSILKQYTIAEMRRVIR